MGEDPSHNSETRSRAIFVGLSAAAVVAFVVIGQSVMLPFLLAVVVAYVLFPLVRQVERLRVARWVAVLLVYALTIGAATGFAWAVVPRLFDEVKSLATDLPNLTRRLRDDWLPVVDQKLERLTGANRAKSSSASKAPAKAKTGLPTPAPAASTGTNNAPPAPIVISRRDDGSFELRLQDELRMRQNRDGSWSLIPKRTPKKKKLFSSARALRDGLDSAIDYAQTNSFELIKLGRSIVGGISRGIFYFFITLMLAGYMMVTFEDIHGFFREMWPPYQRTAFDRFLARLDRGLSGVVRGQLLICLVNGVLTAIGLAIFNVKYWPILSLVAAVMSIIPIFGSILSTVPCVAIGLTQDIKIALAVLAWIVGIHQVEANFLNPKIIGDQAKIHPVLVVFALLLGEHLFQITGALLAVPCLALVQTIFMHFRESVMGIPMSDAFGARAVVGARGTLSVSPTPTPPIVVASKAEVSVGDKAEPMSQDPDSLNSSGHMTTLHSGLAPAVSDEATSDTNTLSESD